MLNREQMQEQLIRYSEMVRTVEAAYKEMTDRVSDHTQQLAQLDAQIKSVDDIHTVELAFQKQTADELRHLMDARINALAVNTGERLRVWEAASRTVWGRVRYLLIGR
jgi:hypothetical protein